MTAPSDAHSLDWMTPERTSDAMRWHVPDGWQQGRGAFGGLVVGAMVRAITAHEPDAARQVRSVTAELIGPVLPGPAELSVRCLRRGNALSTWDVCLTQPSQPDVLAHAVVLTGSVRNAPPAWRPQPALPAPPSYDSLPVLQMPAQLSPVFTQHFEYRMIDGVPYTGASEPRVRGYVQSRGQHKLQDAAIIAAYADAFWPTALPTFTALRPVATVSFMLHLHADPRSVAQDQPLLHSAYSQASSDGYVSETREIYSASGEFLAINHQLIAIIK